MKKYLIIAALATVAFGAVAFANQNSAVLSAAEETALGTNPTTGSAYEVTALTAAAPTLATQGVPLNRNDGTPCTAIRVSVMGTVDAGTSNANDYLTGGSLVAYRYSPALGWQREFPKDLTIPGDGGTGSERAITFTPASILVTGNASRMIYRASAATVKVLDAGSSIGVLMECQYQSPPQ